jgi:hypothetical protein
MMIPEAVLNNCLQARAAAELDAMFPLLNSAFKGKS